MAANCSVTVYFNPRSPHGERLNTTTKSSDKTEFQSTLPARGATFTLAVNRRTSSISIHAPRTGSDRRH